MRHSCSAPVMSLVPSHPLHQVVAMTQGQQDKVEAGAR